MAGRRTAAGPSFTLLAVLAAAVLCAATAAAQGLSLELVLSRSAEYVDRFLIDVETGRIAQAELVLETAFVHATLTTEFRRDDRLGIDAPAEMKERYRLSNGGELTGSATYGRFRRFGVSTEEKVDDLR